MPCVPQRSKKSTSRARSSLSTAFDSVYGVAMMTKTPRRGLPEAVAPSREARRELRPAMPIPAISCRRVKVIVSIIRLTVLAGDTMFTAMPQMPTKYFGPVEYAETDVVQFPLGLPGFDAETRFLMMEPKDSAPLIFLQSVGQPGLCFLTLPVLAVDPQYRLAVAAEDLELLGLDPIQAPQ